MGGGAGKEAQVGAVAARWGGRTLHTQPKAIMGHVWASAFHTAPNAHYSMPTMHGHSPELQIILKAYSPHLYPSPTSWTLSPLPTAPSLILLEPSSA